ncbi:hypothetical protein ACFE04_021648 [Oxalis oulophora]
MVDELNGQIARNELTLGPREDVLQLAIGKAAPTGWSLIGGVTSTIGTFFGVEIVDRENYFQPKTVKKIKFESSQIRLDKGASKSKVIPKLSSDRGLSKSKIVPQLSSDKDVVLPRGSAQSKKCDDSGYQRANISTCVKQNHSSTSRHSPTASEQVSLHTGSRASLKSNMMSRLIGDHPLPQSIIPSMQ